MEKSKQNIKVTDDTFIPCYYDEELERIYMPAKKLESVTVTKEYCPDTRIDIKDVILSFKDSNTFVYLDDMKYLEPMLKYLNSSY